MNIDQQIWKSGDGWTSRIMPCLSDRADWVLVFGSRSELEDSVRFDEIRAMYPQATITMCSTAGEICGEEVLEDSLALTAVSFDKSRVDSHAVSLEQVTDHQEVGEQLGKALKGDDLRLVFVLSDGHSVQVGDLVAGLNIGLGDRVPVTGGLAADGLSFQKTLVGLDGPPQPGQVVAVGLYGKDLRIGHGSQGGWSEFGPVRTVTRSEGNVLYDLDGTPALDLYKEYLGERANELPGAALLFPLAIEVKGSKQPLVRTVLNVDDDTNAMLYAGNIPENSHCRLMHSNFNRIVDGAGLAARYSLEQLDDFPAELSILISCVGRKLLLGLRAEDEVDEVKMVVGEQSAMTGFYSYGELSPLGNNMGCELHNQTMTITTIAEV